MRNQKEPTHDEMFKALFDLGEALRQPGDKQARILERVASETGLSLRTCRAYLHREARRCHRDHLELINQCTEKAPKDELQELRERLDRLERAFVQGNAGLARTKTDRMRTDICGFSRVDCPLAQS